MSIEITKRNPAFIKPQIFLLVGLMSFLIAACKSKQATPEQGKEQREAKNPITSCIDSSKINPEGLCPAVWDPVCGCNGKTYGNECEASHAGVKQYKKGACP